MRIERNIPVTVQPGALTVTAVPQYWDAARSIWVDAPGNKGYLSTIWRVRASISGYPGIGPWSWTVTWGDGTTTPATSSNTPTDVGLPKPSPGRYATVGNKAVTVNVVDVIGGSTGSGAVPSPGIQVAADLTATFTSDPSPATGPVPLTVSFNFSMSGGWTPYSSWTLDYGDGSPVQSNPTPPMSHVYATVGTFTAKFTVTDALGATAIGTAAITPGAILAPSSYAWLGGIAAGVALLAYSRWKGFTWQSQR